ncbi:MAG: thiol oxidoreductase [Cytophagales bacterium]|nr:MAG: thiol oxidoreductase [Cytophagales bacterium]
MNSYIFKKNIIIGLIAIIAFNCSTKDKEPLTTPIIASSDEELSSGKLTVFDQSENSFGNQVPGLTGEESGKFVVGNSFFRSNWVTSPSSTTARDGLGPFFNARSCGSCHAKDGRGFPPESGELDMHSLLFRLSIEGTNPDGSPKAHPEYGGQIQSSAIQGLQAEAQPLVEYIDFEYTYPDGEILKLRKPIYSFSTNYGNLEANVKTSPRVGLQLCGMGLLEAIPENDILKLSDEADSNNDQISGKPNYVWDYESNKKTLGRFGWKANQPSLRQQVAGAFNGDIGITSELFTKEEFPSSIIEIILNLPNGGVPEISNKTIDEVTFYCQTLAVPARRNFKNPDVIEGKQLFTKIGCEKCHHAEYKTSAFHSPSVLSSIVIRPYTDMLLHDMGTALADNREDFQANGLEWRTTPLWGLGLIKTVNNHTFLLHDGRARNIEEAIIWHGGEAENSKKEFSKLNKTDRLKLLQFLNSL